MSSHRIRGLLSLLSIFVAVGLKAEQPGVSDQDVWRTTNTTNAPAARSSHTAVWTGTKMIVWGGRLTGPGIPITNTGGQYDPVPDSWTATTVAGAPTARSGHTAVWTGSKMIIWGGFDGTSGLNTGGQYDPVTDSWTATATAGAPGGRWSHTAVWTGSKMIIWGGTDNTGGQYDPATDSWAATATAGAPPARFAHTAVWTGTRMVVWGGGTGVSFGIGVPPTTNTGGQYDPAANTWTATATAGAPIGRMRSTSVWTGRKMIVWGGDRGSPPFEGPPLSTNTGGQYDPATDSWTATATTGAPTARSFHTAVWTGSKMVVWGGFTNTSENANGGQYDPVTDSWIAMTTAGAPIGRATTAVWTGTRMIVWGDSNTGGQWSPSSGLCTSAPDTLCLNTNRFAVQVRWRVPSQGTSGSGIAMPMTGDTGSFWFFTASNIELVIKILDGRAFNGKFWVFYGALSNVEYTITVADTVTGAVRTYSNPSGTQASIADTSAF